MKEQEPLITPPGHGQPTMPGQAGLEDFIDWLDHGFGFQVVNRRPRRRRLGDCPPICYLAAVVLQRAHFSSLVLAGASVIPEVDVQATGMGKLDRDQRGAHIFAVYDQPWQNLETMTRLSLIGPRVRYSHVAQYTGPDQNYCCGAILFCRSIG